MYSLRSITGACALSVHFGGREFFAVSWENGLIESIGRVVPSRVRKHLATIATQRRAISRVQRRTVLPEE